MQWLGFLPWWIWVPYLVLWLYVIATLIMEDREPADTLPPGIWDRRVWLDLAGRRARRGRVIEIAFRLGDRPAIGRP